MLLLQEANVSGCFAFILGAGGLNGLIPEPPEGVGEMGFVG